MVPLISGGEGGTGETFGAESKICDRLGGYIIGAGSGSGQYITELNAPP